MFGLGFTEILVILAVVLLVVGPEKMPELARTLGRSMFQLRKAADEFREEIQFSKLDLPRNPLGEEVEEIKSFAALSIAEDCPEAEEPGSAEESTSKPAAEPEKTTQKEEPAKEIEE